MNQFNYTTEENNTAIRIFPFESPNGVNEYYVFFSVQELSLTFHDQVEKLLNSYERIIKTGFYNKLPNLKKACPAFKNYFLSDAANQTKELKRITGKEDCAVSFIQQAPLNGTKVALWTLLMTGTKNQKIDDSFYQVSYPGYDEFWSTGNIANGNDSYKQAYHILSDYAQKLKSINCTLADNCIRTWLYVNDIDNNYDGVVKARNDVFDQENLTDKTHYITSTGINGKEEKAQTLCLMNAFAIRGIKNEQIHYLYALSHLNRTSEYGVRFERGTYIDFEDRRRVYISGTASIDNKGDVMYPGDIRKQTERMWENIKELLKEANCNFNDIAEMTIYLRDSADYKTVSEMYNQKFPDTPFIIVHAPVCRPAWLIESECIAIKKI